MTHHVSTISESAPRLVGLGTAVPPSSYTQEELLELFRITDTRIASVFRSGSIHRRHLTLPEFGADGVPRAETQGELLRKHRTTGVDMATRAVEACLKQANAAPSDVRYLVCVSSTGLLTPGISAHVIKEMGLEHDCARLDVVGMGCNAGLNGLTATSHWSAAHPGELAVMVCVEACSAAYVFDGTMRTSVVNSLFGDGAAAVAIVSGSDDVREGPRLHRFRSIIIPDAVEAMKYTWDDDQGKFSFYLDRDIPYVVGAHAEIAISNLLEETGVRRSDVAHWLVHSGGKKVIDSVMINLGLTRHDLRHTVSVLRDYGNLSSGSFLFSYQRLLAEKAVRTGDWCVLMTMGPGSTIETALIRW